MWVSNYKSHAKNEGRSIIKFMIQTLLKQMYFPFPDLEWVTGPAINDTMDNMEVDIGFSPLMELKAELPPMHQMNWDSEITLAEAHQILGVTMYPFKEITYYPFEEAFQRSVAGKKLVHNVVLWGALDDQSC